MESDGPINDLLNALQEIPAGGVVALALLVALGIALWIAGRVILRSVFAVAGLILGGIVGWIVASMFNTGVPAWVVGVLVGAIVACFAALSFRMLLAFGLAAVIGVAAPLAVWTIHDLQVAATSDGDQESNQENARQRLKDALDGTGEYEPSPDDAEQDLIGWLLEDLGLPADTDIPDGMTLEDVRREMAEQGLIAPVDESSGDEPSVFERAGVDPIEAKEKISEAQSTVQRIGRAIADIWKQTPQGLRLSLIVASLLGGILGLLLGGLAPATSAMIVSSGGGAAIWMSSSLTLATYFGASVDQWSVLSPRFWLGAWVIVMIIGLAVQWRTQRKKADKNA